MPESTDRMREDWNQRAREDAHYYVAFGRRSQDEEEFLATAREMAKSFADELVRLPPANPRARRAIEIGCGPGRLLRPMSAHFGEIHGVDVSDEMVKLAAERLADIPHAHPLHAPNSDLSAYADDSFDFLYSYAVFQHIPSRDTVLGYWREARRVLKEGGIARFQLNGLPASDAAYDTWSGVRIPADEVAAFAAEHDFQILALEGIATQYQWTTWRKMPVGWSKSLEGATPIRKASIRRITNAFSSEPVVPTRGRFSSVSLWMTDLPQDADLNGLEVRIGGVPAFISYLGPPEEDSLTQVNAYLPEGLASGLQPVEVSWRGTALCEPATLRLVPPGPPVPRVLSVTDGVNLLSGNKIASGIVKAVVEEVEHPELLEVKLGGRKPERVELFCTDPRLPKYEINFPVPASTAPGIHRLDFALGRKSFAPVHIEVAKAVD